MNVTILTMPHVTEQVLDQLAAQLPVITSEVMQVPGGRLAIVRPDQVSLAFSQASSRDVGADIRIMVYARSNDFRTSTEQNLSREYLDKVLALLTAAGEEYSVNVRLYLMEIVAAEHP